MGCLFQRFVVRLQKYMQNSLTHIHADELRMAVKEVICDNENERFKYEEALIAITVDESLKR